MVSPNSTNQSSSTASAINEIISEKPLGLTLRAILLSLGLAFFFGYIIPIVDMKMRNTFLGGRGHEILRDRLYSVILQDGDALIAIARNKQLPAVLGREVERVEIS